MIRTGFFGTHLSEATDNLSVEKRSNLVAGVTAHSPQKTGFVVVLKERSGGLLVGLQSLGESLLLKLLGYIEYGRKIVATYGAVISTTSQGFASNIVNSGDSRGVPSVVVNTSRRLVDHSAGNTLEDDIGGNIKVDDLSHEKVSGNIRYFRGRLWQLTKFMSTSSSRLSACFLVRGKPSNKKEELGDSEVASLVAFAAAPLKISSAPDIVTPEVRVGLDSTQPRFDNSPTMSLTMTLSAISPP